MTYIHTHTHRCYAAQYIRTQHSRMQCSAVQGIAMELTLVAAVDAPLSSSSFTTSRCPLYAACIKAVLPS